MLRGYDAGAVDYVFKPFDPVMLRSKVSVFVELFEKTREIQQKAALEQQLAGGDAAAPTPRGLRPSGRCASRRSARRRSCARCRSAFMRAPSTPPFGAHFVSEAVERLTGFPPERFTADPDFGLSRVHPDDLPAVSEALGGAREAGGIFLRVSLALRRRQLSASSSTRASSRRTPTAAAGNLRHAARRHRAAAARRSADAGRSGWTRSAS